MKEHIVQFSGGICSWFAGQRVVKKFGIEKTQLLFADTLIEDKDTYRFLVEGAAALVGDPAPIEVLNQLIDLPPLSRGKERCDAIKKVASLAQIRMPHLTWIMDGRNVWEIFFDERFLGNSRVDPCSKILKRELLWSHIRRHWPTATVHVGLDWTEGDRLERLRTYQPFFKIEAPMEWKPLVDKAEMLVRMHKMGIKVPQLYEQGFAHGNCSGFCIKSGQAQFRLLLELRPEQYAYHEAQEQKLREMLKKDVAILRDRRGGETKPLTLKEFRIRIQGGQEHDRHDWGGCGCAID